MKKTVLLGSVFGWLLLTASASAQMTINPVQDYINKTTLLNNILSNKRATDMSQKAMSKKALHPPKASASPQSGVSSTATIFKPSPQTNLPQRLTEGTGVKDPSQARQFFDSQLKLYQQTARKDGFPANDLAYAFEYFVVNNYLTFYDLHGLPLDKDPYIKRGRDSFERISLAAKKQSQQVTLTQERAIYQQFKGLLAKKPEIQKMTDRQKQELAELLAITLGVTLAQYMNEIESNNDKVAEDARQLAKQNLERLLSVPVQRIKISAYGLEW
jgi:hypothetical protein